MSHWRKAALGSAAALGVVVCIFLVFVLAGQGLQQASLWATVVAAPAAIVAAVAAIWPLVAPPAKILVPPKLTPPKWVVDRPAEVSAIAEALLRGPDGTVGITTGLQGAGGFGKTTLALMVCADRRVRQEFRGYVYWVTVGRDVRDGAAVAAKVNDVIKLVAPGEDATFTDPELAGQRLGALLDRGPRRLLVIDDVWDEEQQAPFLAGGRQCARLITTRSPGLVAGPGLTVQVDQMSPEQSRALLTSGLPGLDPVLVEGLLAVTGRWPLLLRLVNKILANAVGAGADVPAAGAQLLAQLRIGGPARADDLSGEVGSGLDVGKPQERARAVRTTIGASLGLLDPQDAQRFVELGVFADNEIIPFSLAAVLWRETAELDDLRATSLCARLGKLALVDLPSAGSAGMALHEVFRDFLRGEAGPLELASLHGRLVDGIAAGMPQAASLDPAVPGPGWAAWWGLGRGDRYLWDHLIEHLTAAGRVAEAEGVACDLRWVGARLERFGPAAPAADLAVAGTARAARLKAVLARAAHLLAVTQPAEAVIDILHSRIADGPEWGAQVTALLNICNRPRLANHWPLPDLPDPALQHALTGHEGAVRAVAIASGGAWLATAGDDPVVRIWDTATWQQRAILSMHEDWVHAVAIAPNGTWLATGGNQGAVRIWDTATWQQRATLNGGEQVEAMAIAPDGTWLATAGGGGTVRIWDTTTWQQRVTLTGHASAARTVAIAPDGTWLATGGIDKTVRIWDTATWRQRAILTGHEDWVHAVAIAPDGTWLASGGIDNTVRIWDTATGQQRATLTGHASAVRTVAIAPDGTWLATGSGDGTVRIWDTATGQDRATLTGRSGWVAALAIADGGGWLTAAGQDGIVRIWDTGTRQQRAVLTGRESLVRAVAVAPGSGLFATVGDGTVRIWDAATGQERAALSGRYGRLGAIAIAPDGCWLATGGDDGMLRIWDAVTGQQRATLADHKTPVFAVAIAPDGRWLATADYNMVRIWDTATGRERAALASNGGTVDSLAIARDGSWLAARDKMVRIWDVESWQSRAAFTVREHSMYLPASYAVAIAPDGDWLATGREDGTVRIWDTATWHERVTLTSHEGPACAIAIAPDSGRLATGGWDGTVRIWDARTGQAQAMMRVEKRVHACAWLDSGVVVVGGEAGLYLFDFLTGNAIDSLRP